jgi:hypothetical protein
LSDLSRETTEDDLWNLDDETGDATLSAVDFPPQPRMGLGPASKLTTPPPESEKETPVANPAPRVRGKTPDPLRSDLSDPAGRRMSRTLPVDEIGDLEEHSPEAAEPAEAEGGFRVIADEEEPPAPAAAAPTSKASPVAREVPDATPTAPPPAETGPVRTNQPKSPGRRLRLNRREIIGLAAFSFTLLLAAIWVITRFFAAFEFKSRFVEGPEFPVSGERAQIERAETYWREPVRTGDSRDFARREITMIPVLELTLSPDKTTSGTLLVIFRNSESEPVGDSIRRSFTGARFDGSGQPTISFPSTDGFVEEGDFNAYRAGKGASWMAEVFEGPSIDSPANEFKLVASIPVLPKLR